MEIGRPFSGCATDDATLTTCDHSDLTGSDVYKYRISAIYSGGQGAWAEIGDTTVVAAAPSTIGQPSVTSSNGANTITWSAPANNGSTITEYTVWFKRNTDQGWTTDWAQACTTTGETSCEHTGLSQNDEYKYHVTATNGIGSSTPSQESPAQTVVAGVPGVPSALLVTSADGTNDISWGASEQNGSPVTGYTVQWSKADATGDYGSYTDLIGCVGTTNLSCAHPNLIGGDKYKYQVKATNIIGDSDWAAFDEITVASSAPSAPENMTVESNAGVNTITWSASIPNGSVITGYEVEFVKDASGDVWAPVSGCSSDDATLRTCAHLGLIKDDVYSYRVRAMAEDATGDWAFVRDITVVALAPSSISTPLVATASGENTITWTAPLSNGSPITGYTVQWSKADASGDFNSFSDLTGCIDVLTLSCTHSSLINGDTYKYQVKATNDVGDSPWSMSDEVVVASLPPSAPGNAQATSSAGVTTVTWDLASSNGSVITGYMIEFAKKDVSNDVYGSWIAVSGCATDDASLTTCDHSDLTSDDVYKYRISATYSGGNGAWAEIGDTTVVAAAPSAIGQPSITSSNGINTITWSAPASNGSAITGYTVWFKRNAGLGWTSDWVEACTTMGETSCDHMGLNKDDEYKYYVTATNGIGSSTPSQESATQAVVAGVPSLPSTLLVVSADGTNDISWGASEQNGSPVTGYTVQWSLADATGDYGAYTDLLDCVGTTNLSCAHPNLIGGDKYKYQVKATNIVGDSDWATSDEITVASSAPFAPENMTVESSAGVNTVNWLASIPNGSVITGYEVEFMKEDGSADVWAPVSGCSSDDASLRTCAHLGLIKDDVYSYRVRAMAEDATGDWSIVRNTTVVASVPSIISTPLVTTMSGENTITWTTPANNGSLITGYTVQWSKADATGDFNSFTDLAGCVDVLTLSCTHSSLINGDTYKYQVKATNAVGDSPWSMSDEVVVASLPPSAPGNAQATSSAGVTTVTWDLASSNGSVITGYTVEFAKKDVSNDVYGDWTFVSGCATDNATLTTCDHSDLTGSDVYKYRISATYSGGQGAWAEIGDTTVVASAPSAIGQPSITSSNGINTITWSAPASNGSAITGYTVWFKRNTSLGWTSDWVEACTTTGATSCDHTGLSKDDEYKYYITATNGIGSSTPSQESATQTVVAGVPAIPSILLVTSADGTNDISWGASEQNGSPITGYTVQWSLADATGDYGAYTDLLDCVGTTNLSCTHPNLIGGDKYKYQVKATNIVGDSGWATSDEITVASSAPSAPGNMTVQSSAGVNTVNWLASIPNGSVITGYEVEFIKEDGSADIWAPVSGCSSDDVDLRTCSHLGLMKDDVYSYRVRAMAEDATGDWSIVRNTTVVALAPSIMSTPLVTTASGENTITWTAPANNGSPITGYTVQWSKADATGDFNSFTDLAGCVDVLTLSCTHSSLINGDTYKYQVKATNAVGDSPWSMSDEVVVASLPPSAPTNAQATSSAGVTTVTWDLASSNGSVITGYTVEFAKKDVSNDVYGDWTFVSGCATDDATLTTCDHSDLTSDDIYKYRVSATYSGGNGAWTEIGDTTVVANIPSTIGQPSIMSANGINTITWSAPANNGSAITGYTVWFKRNTNLGWTIDWMEACTTTGETSCDHMGLNKDDEYKYYVTATNGIGSSTPSQESATQAVVAGVPGLPSTLLVVSADGTNDISWGASEQNGSPVTGYTVQWSKADATGDYGVYTDLLDCVGTTGLSCAHPNLIGGDKYKYQVKATNIVGDSGWATSDETTVASSAPSAPENMAVESNAGVNTITWLASIPNGSVITGYEVEFVKEDGSADVWDPVSGCSSDDVDLRTCSHLGLMKDDVYSYRVRAMAEDATGDWSIVRDTTVVASVPSIISTPLVTTASGANTITWTAPANNGSLITGYTVQWSLADASGDFNSFSDLAGCIDVLTLSCTHSSLVNGDTYKYQVKATNNVGDSAWSMSDEVVVASLPPSAPTNAQATSSAGVTTITWDLASSNGSVITGYTVEFAKKDVSNDVYGSWTPVSGCATDDATLTTCDHSDLTSDDVYKYRISATYSGGNSDWAEIGDTMVVANIPSTIGQPSITSANGINTITWSAPANNGSAITGYTVWFKRNTNLGWTTDWAQACTTTGETSCDHTGLSKDDQYKYYVTATNGIGSSTPSQESPSQTVVAGVPGLPSTLLVVSADGTNDISWGASESNGSPVTGYTVQWSLADATGDYGAYTNLAGCVGTTNLSCAHANLVGGDKYKYQVRATNIVGDSGWSISDEITVASSAPSAPENMAVASNAGVNTITWSASIPNGSVITGYEVEFVKDGSGDVWAPVSGCSSDDATLRACAHLGLMKDDIYSYRVRAMAEDATGDWSIVRNTTVVALAPSIMSTPLVTTASGANTITWTAPANNGSPNHRLHRSMVIGRCEWRL